MKVIIAGSRSITDVGAVALAVHLFSSRYPITEFVSGGARGVDRLGEHYAKHIASLPCRVFPAEWNKYGLRAGIVRNRQMAEYADALIALWDGQSKGTKNMIETMLAMGKPVMVFDQHGDYLPLTSSPT